MSNPDLGPILEDLASGRIDAAEAARRIDALKNESPKPAPEPTPVEPSNEELAEEDDPGRRQYSPHAREVFGQPSEPTGRKRAGGTKGVDRIAVRAVGRRVRIVGDASVATASAEGPHVLRRNGSVLEVSSDGELGPSFDGFSILHPPRNFDDIRALGLGKELVLRVNPGIVLDVEVTAGHLVCTEVPHLGKVRVTAGGAELRGISEANDVLVQAGSATLAGAIVTGRSRVRVESGQLTIELDDASNVTVRADAQLGKVTFSGAHSGAVDELVLGNGSARLDVGVVMGWANVVAGSEPDDQQ
ncbi:hypothetical protein [Propionicimonas sp.]|uniref:hypothetical protein n=1 Tax=Propionicimonas sp. TaxID=1955623 RepID=UPI0017D53368|nr:hypothetical protein [Propionicimonas sp.]MBU3976457.1 hypothetical protein [Actinomycetota bacterium]MBA3020297.1 hypothetical protein [Propionicimonas sp.]MBU3986084.1 hypothetical protein [Actinomycetota bacterium]MBU4007601.1 hypothetical protein [Actinomycetota bacterium]MBU4064382.1 hypothetical protein [Actinomycetota bacterium]